MTAHSTGAHLARRLAALELRMASPTAPGGRNLRACLDALYAHPGARDELQTISCTVLERLHAAQHHGLKLEEALHDAAVEEALQQYALRDRHYYTLLMGDERERRA